MTFVPVDPHVDAIRSVVPRTPQGCEECLRLGWAHGALLTTFPGDVSMAKLHEVEALAKGGTARVQR